MERKLSMRGPTYGSVIFANSGISGGSGGGSDGSGGGSGGGAVGAVVVSQLVSLQKNCCVLRSSFLGHLLPCLHFSPVW